MNRQRSLWRKVVADEPVPPFGEAMAAIWSIAASAIESAGRVVEAFSQKNYWAAQTILVAARERFATGSVTRMAIQSVINYVFTLIGEQIRTSDLPPKHEVEFGTSGWRGVLGEDFTFRNTLLAAEAIVNVLKRPEVLTANKVANWEELKTRGCVIGHDNRFMAKEMAELLAGVMAREGIKIYWVGEASTPEVAAVLRRKNAAFSLNLTPSHNPFTDSGLKFNPFDAGPAGPEFTRPMEAECRRLMKGRPDVQYLRGDALWSKVEVVDSKEEYRQMALKLKGVSLARIIEQMSGMSNDDLLVVVDYAHGAARGRLEHLLGPKAAERMQVLRNNDDYLFSGVKPEPNIPRMREVQRQFASHPAKLKLYVLVDADGDRILLADGENIVEMNAFGAMAAWDLLENRLTSADYGGNVVVRSFGTSRFVDAIASRFRMPVVERDTGFKSFREHTGPNSALPALVAYEEADGLCMGDAMGHFVDKDALLVTLLALQMVLAQKKNLGDIYHDLRERFDYFWPARDPVGTDRSLPREERARRLDAVLSQIQIGSIIPVTGESLGVSELKVTKVEGPTEVFGYRFTLEGGHTIMLRPSGTEPKVRVYVEAVGKENEALAPALIQAAHALVKQAFPAVNPN